MYLHAPEGFESAHSIRSHFFSCFLFFHPNGTAQQPHKFLFRLDPTGILKESRSIWPLVYELLEFDVMWCMHVFPAHVYVHFSCMVISMHHCYNISLHAAIQLSSKCHISRISLIFLTEREISFVHSSPSDRSTRYKNQSSPQGTNKTPAHDRRQWHTYSFVRYIFK